MSAKKKEYAVEVEISGILGRVTVFTRAVSEEEAIENANRGEWYGGELIEWSAEDAVSAEVNKVAPPETK